MKSKIEKLHKKYKNTKLEENGFLYRSSRNKVQSLIHSKKQSYIRISLEENKINSKKLWNCLKNLGLPSFPPKSGSEINLNIDGELNSNNTYIADHFDDFYSTLAENLVEQLPTAPNKYGKNKTTNYYEGKNLQNDNFIFEVVDQLKIYRILENINDSKSPGFDNIPGRFLKDGGKIISKYIADIFDLSIT